MQQIGAVLDQRLDNRRGPEFGGEVERRLVAPRVPDDAVRGDAVLQQERRQREVVGAQRRLERVVVAVVGLVGPVVVGQDATVEVCDQGGHDVGVAVLAGVLYGAVAVLVLADAIVVVVVLSYAVPGGVMGERKLHGREVVMRDPACEDSGGEALSGDSRGENRPEELVQRVAGADEAAQEDSGHIVDDVKHELARKIRERHGGIAGSKGGSGYWWWWLTDLDWAGSVERGRPSPFCVGTLSSVHFSPFVFTSAKKIQNEACLIFL